MVGSFLERELRLERLEPCNAICHKSRQQHVTLTLLCHQWHRSHDDDMDPQDLEKINALLDRDVELRDVCFLTATKPPIS